MRISIIVISLFSLLFTACVQRINITKEQNALFELDKKFSEESKQAGLANAYLNYADSNAVWLIPNSLPVKGIIALKDRLSNIDSNLGIYTWRPLSAEVSLSGDIGYTYGNFQYLSSTNDSIFSIGTYVTIWKRKKKQDWKWVLTSANNGL